MGVWYSRYRGMRRARARGYVDEGLGVMLFTAFLGAQLALHSGYDRVSQTRYAAEVAASESAGKMSFDSCISAVTTLSDPSRGVRLDANVGSFSLSEAFSSTLAMIQRMGIKLDVATILKALVDPGKFVTVGVVGDSSGGRSLVAFDGMRAEARRLRDCSDVQRVDLARLLPGTTNAYFAKFGIK